jgi:ArsR family metal-binding transcriptional regulator
MDKEFLKKGGMLPLARDKAEIRQNALTLGNYLEQTNSSECEYAKKLIRRGRCFVIVESESGYSFFPSRFMGYIGNTREAHERMGELKKLIGTITKDGRDTNEAISAILGELVKRGDDKWDKWEMEYKKFCKKVGIVPYNVKRKYWRPIKLTDKAGAVKG